MDWIAFLRMQAQGRRRQAGGRLFPDPSGACGRRARRWRPADSPTQPMPAC